MDIFINCPCGRRLKASSAFIGTTANCPFCNRLLTITAQSQPPPVCATVVEPEPSRVERWKKNAHPIPEYREPPNQPVPPRQKRTISWRKMFEALLDPRSIQWMLAIGGGLGVLGLLIWLGSLGLFQNMLVLAAGLGISTAAILAGGWWLTLKTRYQMAGRALTALGCLVAPLNLWFYHAQGLVTLDGHLWVGGLVCCLLYVATVWLLRDPLFIYVVEAGVTLTVALLLAELQCVSDTTYLASVLMALGLLSIHAERIFPPHGKVFNRRRFGMPLFWSGQAQVAVALLLLGGTQVFGWLIDPARAFVRSDWPGNHLTQSNVLPAALWLAGAYAYLYSDIIVRRIGVYVYLAACCVLMAALTLVGLTVESQWLIAGFAIAGVAVNVIAAGSAREDRLRRAVRPIAFVANFLAILLGVVLHVRATSLSIPESWHFEMHWKFVGVMLIAAASTRISAWLLRDTSWSAWYLFGSAAALLIAAAGALRQFGLVAWLEQAPWLMLLAIGYMAAAYLWRGHDPEQPLGMVAHAATALIVGSAILSAGRVIGLDQAGDYKPAIRLYLAVVFIEAMVFYIVAAVVRRRSANVHLAAVAACGAIWQLLGYFDVAAKYHTIVYTVLGLAFLAAGRVLGVQDSKVYDQAGEQKRAIDGKGRTALAAGNAILTIALAATLFLQGSALMLTGKTGWIAIVGLCLTIVASLAASVLVPQRAWRRLYVAAAIALGAVLFLSLQVLIHLSTAQKVEIFCTVIGILMIVLGYIGRFRESGEEQEGVTIALWLGSVLATLPVLIATMYYRAPGRDISGINELSLLIITILMLVTGLGLQVKSTTILGGGVLLVYLVMVVVSLGLRNQVAVGIYLTIGGGALFGIGILLSIYRDKLLDLPNRIARREGLFRVLNWR